MIQGHLFSVVARFNNSKLRLITDNKDHCICDYMLIQVVSYTANIDISNDGTVNVTSKSSVLSASFSTGAE